MALAVLRIRGSMRRARGDESGQALVELALTTPLLILLLLGAVEFGRVAFTAIELSNAAKAAAQYGAQNLLTATDQPGMQAVAQADASALTAGTVTVSVDANTCSCSSPDTATAPFACRTATSTSCPSPSSLVQTITVTASAPFNPGIWVPGFSHANFTLYGTAVQKRLQ